MLTRVVVCFGVGDTADTTGVDHSRLVADGTAKRVVVSGSSLVKSRDSFHVVARATACGGSSALAGTTAVVDSSGAGSEGSELEVDVSLNAGTAADLKLCVRYGSGAADAWFEFNPNNGGDLTAVAVTGFTADVLPVLPGVVSNVLTISGQSLDPSDVFVVVASATTCQGTTVAPASGASLGHSSGAAGADQVFNAVTSAVDASLAATYKLCMQPGGAAPAQFGEVNAGAAVLFGAFPLSCLPFPLPLSPLHSFVFSRVFFLLSFFPLVLLSLSLSLSVSLSCVCACVSFFLVRALVCISLSLCAAFSWVGAGGLTVGVGAFFLFFVLVRSCC